MTVDKKLIKKWRHIQLKRLELALYQYSLGVVTAGAVLEELRMMKVLDEAEKAVRGGRL